MTVEPPILNHLSDIATGRQTVEFHSLPVPDHVVKHSAPLSLSGGRPHQGFYPVRKVTYELVAEPFGEPTTQAHVLEVDPTPHKLDLKNALNYGASEGAPELVTFCKELVSYINKPGYADWDITCSTGSADSLHKVFNLLVNPGDTVMMECYTFVPTINNITSWGGSPIPVAMNFEDGGIDAEKLDSLLTNWSTGEFKDKPKPRVLYTIPTGQNPTGLTLKLEQRKKIYALAQKHDFVIVEDDPYGYIQLGAYSADNQENIFAPGKFTADDFVARLTPSYVSIDTEGRVLRLETFSKVFAPGSRVGFIVGHKELIKNIKKHIYCSNRGPSGLSQATILATIAEYGGVKGWIDWCVKISRVYTERKNVFMKTLMSSVAYKKGYFKCNEPDAGMFITIDIRFPEGDDHRLEMEELGYKTVTNGVDVVLGKNMAFTPEYAKAAQYVRLTVATASNDEELLEAGSRLTRAIEEYFESTK